MINRFAGDIFSRPFYGREENKSSVLTKYFPELSDFSKKFGTGLENQEAKTMQGFRTPAFFAGFKPMKSTEKKGVPEFGGFKPTAS